MLEIHENIWKRRKCDSNLLVQIATLSTQTVSQLPKLRRKFAEFPSKGHLVWL